MNKTRSLILFLAIFSLSACQGGDDTAKNVAADKTAAPAPMPVPTGDPNAINGPLPVEGKGARLALSGEPKLSAEGKDLEVSVEVTNTGASALYGVGAMPVNIGVQILGADNSAESADGVRDFVRAPLPLITHNGKAVVVAKIPADPRIDGRMLRIALVQEGVGWFADGQNALLEVGPYKVCEGSICDAAGNPLSR